MAEKPQTLRDAAKSGQNARSTSHGRGGAGNINNKPGAQRTADDLRTPDIKSQHYTTGRGGTGNIVSNDNPANARKAQDVEAPLHHDRDLEGTYHWGRGGEGNKMKIGLDAHEKQNSGGAGEKRSDGAVRRGSFQGVLEKGKEMLGLGGGKGKKDEGGSAIEEEGEAAEKKSGR